MECAVSRGLAIRSGYNDGACSVGAGYVNDDRSVQYAYVNDLNADRSARSSATPRRIARADPPLVAADRTGRASPPVARTADQRNPNRGGVGGEDAPAEAAGLRRQHVIGTNVPADWWWARP